jgi:serine/threonine-protein kinase
MKRYMTTALLGLAFALTAACGYGEDKKAEAASFASAVEGSDALVGVVVDQDDDKVLAYVCDGKSLGTWFTGAPNEDGTLALTAADGARLTGRIAGGQLSGTVTLPGDNAPHPFTASTVSAPAGLYRTKGEVRGQAAVGGWIVLADGRQRGGIRTSSGFTSSDTDLAKPTKPVTSFTDTSVDF